MDALQHLGQLVLVLSPVGYFVIRAASLNAAHRRRKR